MNYADILVALCVAAALTAAVVILIRNKNKGCKGGCAFCSRECCKYKNFLNFKKPLDKMK